MLETIQDWARGRGENDDSADKDSLPIALSIQSVLVDPREAMMCMPLHRSGRNDGTVPIKPCGEGQSDVSVDAPSLLYPGSRRRSRTTRHPHADACRSADRYDCRSYRTKNGAPQHRA